MSFPKISFGKDFSKNNQNRMHIRAMGFSIAKIELIFARHQCNSKIKPNSNRR